MDRTDPPQGAPPVPPGRSRRGPIDLVGIYLRGLAMGAADIVPGVSGGTMALILGVYRELIASLRLLPRRPVLQPLLRGRLGRAFHAANGVFLGVLGAGIATSVGVLAGPLEHLLERHPAQVYAFFFGLILASVGLVGVRIGRWRGLELALAAAGAGLAFVLVGLTPASTPDGAPFLVFSGALAICALVLPGVSGAYVLVLLGKYDRVLGAVSAGDVATLAAVGAGAIAGLLSFVQVLGWLLRRYHDPTLAVLTGFMLGSLRKVWPWQRLDGPLSVNVAPPSLPEALVGLGLAVAGAAAVVALERLAARHDRG